MPHYENRQVGEANEVPFEVPESWEWIQIKDVCEVARGGSPRPIKDYLTNDPSGINWIKIGDTTKDGKYIDSAKEKIKPEGVRKSRIVHKGDFLLTNSMSFGRPYILRIDGCIHDGWLVISPMSNSYQSDFLYYLLSSVFAYEQFSEIASGGVVTNLNSDKVADSFFPLPPYKEQIRIVEEIEKWYALIDTLETAKEDLQTSIAQAKSKILDLAIHGKLVPQDTNDEPAIELLKRINPKFTPCDNAQYPYDVPENWKWCKLTDLCSFLSRGKSPTYSDERIYPVFAQKCNLFGGDISLEQARFLDPNTLSKWPEEYKLRDGDVLVNSTGTGTVGRTRLFHIDVLGNFPFVVPDSHVSVVRTLDQIDSNYIYSIMSSRYGQEYIEDNLAGSTNQKELYIGVLENMLIPLPPYNEQKRIVTKIEELFAVLDEIQKSIEA